VAERAQQTVHLIRHGESLFNALCAQAPWSDPMLFDAPLSASGEAQVAELRRRVTGLPVELVVTSPLTRALQTALGAFGGNGVPILVEALHCERVEASCDVGRSPGVLAAEFPALRFDHLEDPWWYADGVPPGQVPWEPEEVFTARVDAFRAWLAARPERTIAVIGHGAFFSRLTGQRLANCELVTLTP
jgi:broad specificity phosphatase PhoE